MSELEISKSEKLFEAAEKIISFKKQMLAKRCAQCWHAPYRCLCHRLAPLPLATPVHFVTFMHYREYGNAGDTSKLLLAAFPGRAELLIYGCRADHERLAALLNSPLRSMVMFPNESARGVADFLRQPSCMEATEADNGKDAQTGCVRGEIDYNENETVVAGAARPMKPGSSSSGSHFPPTAHKEITSFDLDNRLHITSEKIIVIILDGTWRQARRMQRCLEEMAPGRITYVTLNPDATEWGQTRNKRSEFSRKQPSESRVCSLEACAILLMELGETDETATELLRYVSLNRRAVKGMAKSHLE